MNIVQRKCSLSKCLLPRMVLLKVNPNTVCFSFVVIKIEFNDIIHYDFRVAVHLLYKKN
jgi:hypothetical protein